MNTSLTHEGAAQGVRIVGDGRAGLGLACAHSDAGLSVLPLKPVGPGPSSRLTDERLPPQAARRAGARWMKKRAVLLLGLALPGLSQAAGAGLCDSGRRQSPVDIVAAQRQALPDLQFHYRAAPARVVNDGHSVRVRFANGSHLLAGRERYTLQQFHFHLPGGDRIAGEDFPMGMHFTHKAPSGQLMALVVLFRLGAEHPALAVLLPHLPQRGQAERTLPDVQVDARQWLPAQGGYYAYDGSLTSPPCTEGVRWLVMKQPLTISPAQLARLQGLFPPNARPVQPLHGRVVLEHE